MAARTLDALELREAELLALARAAGARLAGRPRPAPGKRRRPAPAAGGGDFLGLREYAPGDSLRAVNWLASARGGQIQTQVYAGELASRWQICLDGSASMSLGEGKWLLARQIAAAFAYLLLHAGNAAGLLVYSAGVDACCPPGRGHSQYPRLLALLRGSLPRAGGGASSLAACADRLPAGSSVLAVSDFLDGGAMRETLGRWRGLGLNVHAIQTLADDECALPPGEALTLRDIETGERRLLEPGHGLARPARARLEALTGELGGYCAKRLIPYTRVDPARGWKAGLLAHLKALGPAP